MRIRTKLISLAAIFIIGALLFTGLGLFTIGRVNAINNSVQKGIEMQVRSREVHSLMKDMVFDIFVPKIYGQLKSYTYSPRTTVTVKEWRNSITLYQDSFNEFMETSKELTLANQELLDQYETAQTMHNRAMERLDDLNLSINKLVETLNYVDEGRFDYIFNDEAFIPFFEEFRDTTYYFVDSFESFMNYFIEQYSAYGQQLERQLFVIYGILTVLITALGITVSMIFSRDIIRKIGKVRTSFERVSKGDFSAKMLIPDGDEFGELATQFNSLSLDLKGNVDTILGLSQSVGTSISNETDLGEMMDIIVDTVIDRTQGDLALLHFIGTDPDSFDRTKLKLNSRRGVEGDLPAEPLAPLLETVLEAGRPKLLSGATLRELFPDLASLMIQPLFIDKRTVGTLTVAIHKPSAPFTDLGIVRLSTFAQFASLMMDNHIKYLDLISKGEAEYQALQSQVQPHFIYNILNGFIGLNRLGDKSGLEKSIMHLKNMLRYTQDSRRDTTLAEEFSFIENYCELQRLRFGERLNYRISLEGALSGIRIPRLLLQPLAENAVLHGIEPLQDRTGELEVEGFLTMEEDQRMITIVVRDNGVGFSMDTLEEREHIGIGNARKRFKYAFTNSAFNIKSSPGSGTEIRMTFHEMHHS